MFTPRSASVALLFSWSPWLVLTCAPPFARLAVAATRRMRERERRKHLFLFPPLLSRCSPQLRRQQLSLRNLLQQDVIDDSTHCWCVALACPLGCPARFCSAACFVTHQASCPFVAFAKPVMITFHESLKGATIGWAVAQQRVPMLLNPCSVMLQRSSSATGCFTAGSLHPLSRSPTVEFWLSLRSWFECVQHVELSLSGSRAALGRSLAQVRDAGRVLSGLVSRFRQALLDGFFWLALLPRSGKCWGSQAFLQVLKWDAVFQSPVFGWSCSGFSSVQYVLLQLSRVPPCSGTGFSFRGGALTRFFPASVSTRDHSKHVSGAVAGSGQASATSKAFTVGPLVNFPAQRVHALSPAS